MPPPHHDAPGPGPLPPLPPPDRAGDWRDALAFYGMLGLFAGCFIGWGLIALPLSALLPPRIGLPLGRRAIGAGFRFLLTVMERADLVRLDLSALTPLQTARGLVVAPNHLSMLDVMLVVSHLPDAVCIMKAGLERNPALGGGRLAGYIPADSGLPLIRRAAEELRQGANLLVFPEGTRSPDGRVGPFHPGFVLIARRAGAPIQPVFLESNTRYLGKGWPVWRRPAFPLRYRARLGERVTVTGGAEAFAEALRRQHVAALGAAS